MTNTLVSGEEYGAEALIVCDNLVRIYQVENIEVQALQGLDLLVDRGEMIAIVGQSGSGKSTLLNVLSGLDAPTAGAAKVAGWDLLRMTSADRLNYRRSVVGFVWQQTARNLLPYLNARENVMLPMAFAGISGRKRIKKANELLDAMGMGAKAGNRPNQLSGGEQQRVAIAVALANSPEVIFADEPTGELDSATGADVFEALRSANRDLGATVVIVTHDHAVATEVQRTVAIRDGRTATEVVRRTHIGEDGVEQTIHEEYAVLDRAGRLQLPADYRQSLKLRERVRLELEDDHIGIWPDGVPKKAAAPEVATPESAAEVATAPVADAPEPTVGEPVATERAPEATPVEPAAVEDVASIAATPVMETPAAAAPTGQDTSADAPTPASRTTAEQAAAEIYAAAAAATAATKRYAPEVSANDDFASITMSKPAAPLQPRHEVVTAAPVVPPVISTGSASSTSTPDSAQSVPSAAESAEAVEAKPANSLPTSLPPSLLQDFGAISAATAQVSESDAPYQPLAFSPPASEAPSDGLAWPTEPVVPSAPAAPTSPERISPYLQPQVPVEAPAHLAPEGDATINDEAPSEEETPRSTQANDQLPWLPTNGADRD